MHVNLYRLRKQLENTELVFEVDDQSRYRVRGNPSLWIWDPSVKSKQNVQPMRRTPRFPRVHIPAATDPFFGRATELAELHSLLEQGRRLIPVRGPPGTGKTRLCMEFIRSEQTQAQRRVWFCDLSEAKSLEGVLHAMASSLKLPLNEIADTDSLVTRLGHAIAGRGASLWVIDNAEQVRGAVASVVKQLLTQAMEVCILVTSRSSLGLSEEQVFALDPLPLPQSNGLNDVADSDAVRLLSSGHNLCNWTLCLPKTMPPPFVAL